MRKTLLCSMLAASCFTGNAMAERGADGQLNIIYWQAVSILNPFLSSGTKDIEAASLVIEPLAKYDEKGNMVANLVDEIPTVGNGGVSEDLKSITWKLSDGLVWSDGSKVTSADVAFTAAYCMHPEGGCAQISNFTDVESVEEIDESTVKVVFSVAKPFPYGPFVGSQSPILQKAQFEDCMGAKAPLAPCWKPVSSTMHGTFRSSQRYLRK